MRSLNTTVVLAITTASLLGAQGGAASTHPGTLKVVDQISSNSSLSVGQRVTASATANKVVAILRRNPGIATPVGYTMTLHVTARRRQPGDTPGPDVREVIYGTATYLIDEDGAVRPGGPSFDFHIAINAAGYPAEIDSDDPVADHGPRIMGADAGNLEVYRETGTFRGRSIYAGDCTYLTHRPTPPVVPVTTERYLSLRAAEIKATAARHDSQFAATSRTPTSDALKAFLHDRPQRDSMAKIALDAMRRSGATDEQMRHTAAAFKQTEAQSEAGLRQQSADGTDRKMQDLLDQARAMNAEQVASAQAAVDGLSASERAAPARVVQEGRGEVRLARAGDADDVIEPLMQLNTAFYDRSLSADQPQLIWLCAHHLQGLPDTGYERLAEGSTSRRDEKAWNERWIRDIGRLRDQLDWAALEALLRP